MNNIIVVLMFASLLSSCSRLLNQGNGGSKNRHPAPRTAPAKPTAAEPSGTEHSLIKHAGIERYYLNVDGDTRTFLVQLPQGYDPSKAYPVVFFFHSIRGKDTSWIKSRNANIYVDKNQYIGVYGQGANGGYWNVGGNYPFKKVNEPHFVQVMYNWLQTNTKIDSKKVFAIGTSNGAILIHYLAIHMNIFAAVASISGSLYVDEMNSDATPVAMLQIHGQTDKTVPYGGGYNPWGYTFLSAENTAQDWAKVNGCKVQPAVTQLLNNKVTAYTYGDCKSGKPVILYSLPNVPHKVMQSFDTNWLYDQIFDFFAKNS